jgi:hypothetical protein
VNVERAARRTAAGGISGGAATLAMSGAMLAAGRLGLMGEYPPERIARRGLRDTGWGPISAEQLDGPVGAALHVAFGAMLGAAFAAGIAPAVGALRRRLPARPSPAVVLPIAGVAFGSVVWAVSYWGLIPSLGILPPPDRDRPDRQVAMLAAHWVFGASLGLALAALADAGLGPADRMIEQEVAA